MEEELTETPEAVEAQEGSEPESPASGPDAAASSEATFVDAKLVDPNQLPEEWPDDMRDQFGEHFKRMQGSYTKKMQGIADLNRKSQQLDAVMQYPEVREAMAERLAGRVPQQAPPPEDDLSNVNLSELSDNELVPYFTKLIDQRADSLFKQHLKEREPIEQATLQMTLSTEASKVDQHLKSQYGKLYEKHRGTVNEYLGQLDPQTGRPLWHGLALSGQLREGAEMKFKDIAFHDAFSDAKSEAQADLHAKKNANLTTTRAPAASTKSRVDYSGMSDPEKWQAAFESAKKKTGLKGFGEEH
jgi:hypothetical protein